MEQHKVLLIIVSVTVLLAAIVGVGLWLFYPRDDAAEELAGAPAGETGGFEWQPLDYLQGEGEVPGLEIDVPPEEQLDEFEVTYGVADEGGEPAASRPSTIVTSPPSSGAADTTAAGSAGTADASTRGAPQASGEGEPAAPVTGRGTAAATSEAAAGTVASARPDASEPAATRGAAASEPSEELSDRAYWVQAISSPNRDTVEQAQRTLREHQLGSRILTKVINDRTYYRLRIGPFAVRAEAEKFLGWVQAIDDFGDAMIFVDYSTPVLAARPQ